jgi:CDGSH-type Zn-finger protein
MDGLRMTTHTHSEVILCPGGPMIIRGQHTVFDEDGEAHQTRRPVSAVCRCGKSSIRPWCDGTHKVIPGDPAEERRTPTHQEDA